MRSPPRPLDEYTLRELIDARDAVQRSNGTPGPNGTTVHAMVCDDRLLAALYVAHHYDAVDPGRDIEPIAVAGDRAVVVLRMQEGA